MALTLILLIMAYHELFDVYVSRESTQPLLLAHKHYMTVFKGALLKFLFSDLETAFGYSLKA